MDAEQIALLRRTVIPQGTTDDDAKLFIETCDRLHLDPFARQVFPVQRNVKDGYGAQATWKKVTTTQVSIDGFRLVAERTGKYAGQLGPFWTADGEKWVEVWLSKDPPAAAKVAVLRSDFKEPLTAVATWEAYKQTNNQGLSPMWAKMGALMLAKCAESLALRRAFPNELSGVYTVEEMAQATPAAVAPRLAPIADPDADHPAMDLGNDEIRAAMGKPAPEVASPLPKSPSGAPAQTPGASSAADSQSSPASMNTQAAASDADTGEALGAEGVKAIRDAVKRLTWKPDYARKWLTARFGIANPEALSQRQGANAYALLNLFGKSAYDAALAEMVASGEARP